MRPSSCTRRGSFRSPEYTFKHALTHEVTYGALLQDRRKALHARIVGAIERGYPDRLSEHVERLAHHAMRGELWEQAVAYLRQSGVKALAYSGSREASSAFEQALAALAHLPEGRATVEQGIDLRFELRLALQALGEHQRVVDYLHGAETLAATLDDQCRLGWVSGYLSQYFAFLGEPERAAEAGQRALTIGSATGDLGLQVLAHFYLGQLAISSGDYQRAKLRPSGRLCNRLDFELIAGRLPAPTRLSFEPSEFGSHSRIKATTRQPMVYGPRTSAGKTNKAVAISSSCGCRCQPSTTPKATNIAQEIRYPLQRITWSRFSVIFIVTSTQATAATP